MVQTLNFINLSSQQAPNDVDWAGLVNSGVQGVLIRLGHGIIRDPCASGHIAKAKQYGLYWHGYHTYEGVVNEPQFTIKNATELGLSTSQYYFVDLTKSSDPFNDYYALHATWLSQGYSTGLLISNEDYLSKFNNSEVIASGTLRWLISDTEPADYDVWQYSSEGTVGTSSVKVGFNFAKTDKLKYNLNTTLTGADINKDPYNPETPVGGAYIGWGYDTTGLGGGKTFGYSTNGKNFYALVGPDGLIVRKNDGNRIYGTIADQIDSAISANVIPAKSAADSAVSAADAAVASAQVTSDAVTAIASATAEAKQGANEAMSRAESAWDVATGAKEAVTDFDPLLKSAQSDASKALTQIADTASALSDAKTSFGSDVAEAKQLANTAQTTADSAVESASENAKALASQANALSDAKKAMDSGVASATGLANAAQTTADNAIKSASSVANDLAAVASQAKANASGITKVTSDVGLLQTTVADNSGNISKVQETAAQLQQAVSDNSGAIVTATQTAQSATTVASDAKSNATVAVQTANGASVTAKNAQGDATTAMVTTKSAVTQASDAKSNATIAVQTASEASVTATNAQGDASFAKQTASDASVQIKNAQGDISKLQTRAGAIETSVANNSGAIADVQATANQLKASVSDNAGNITVAKQTADSAVTVASDAKSNATVAVQTASQASITASNASGQAASAVITANGAMTTASDAKSNAAVAVQTASGASLTAVNAQSDATVAKQTASEAKVQASNAESDFAQISIRANKIEANVATNSGAIASVQQTANGLTTTVADITSNGGGRNLWVGSKTFANTNVNAPEVDWNTDSDGTVIAHITGIGGFYGKWQYIYANSIDPFEIGDSGTFSVEMKGTGTITIGRENDFQKAITLTSNWTRYAISGTVNHTNSAHIIYNESGKDCDVYVRLPMVEKGTVAHDWSPAHDDVQNQFTQTKQTIDGITTTINDPKTGLNATYQTAAGNATTISNIKGDVTQLQTTANGLTSRVGSLESKTATQQTTIDQNKAAIALKADQTAVDTLKGTVSQNTATLQTQASQIQAKVSASDVSGMLTDYATQTYTQSLISQKAGSINETITQLDTKFKTGMENSVQLVQKSDFEDGDKGNWTAQAVVSATNPVPPAELGQSGMKVLQTNTRDSYENGIWYSVKPGEKFDVDYWCAPSTAFHTTFGLVFYDRNKQNPSWQGISSDQSGQWKHYTGTITAPANSSFAIPWYQMEKPGDNTTNSSWIAKPSIRRQNASTISAIQSIQASVDGLKSIVANKTDESQFTQLSNLVQTKVSSDDFTSTTTQLKNEINQRVQVGDVISQINQEAGGDTLIQVSNGKKSLILDAENTIITGEAWIPSAAISSISADKVMLGSSALYNSDGTLNLVNQSNGLKALIQVKQGLVQNTMQSIISFSSDYNNRAFSVTPVGATITPTLFFERYDQTAGHWLGFTRNEVRRDGLMFHTWDDEGERFFVGCHARFDRNISVDGSIYQGTWNGTNGKPLAGVLSIQSGNTIWSGSDFLAIGDHLSNSFTNVMARSFSQQSTLSSKTNIETVDPKDALDLVNRTDIRSYQYKTDVAEGKTKRYTSLIIDDVNDVSEYYAPDEFTNEERTGRDDGSAVGYLFLAIQELTRRIKTLEEKLNG
ncbi:tail fiber domain-containing protein [Limosilactobacillus fermentum]